MNNAEQIIEWSFDAINTASKLDINIYSYKEFINCYILKDYCSDEHVIALDTLDKVNDKLIAVFYVNDEQYAVEMKDSMTMIDAINELNKRTDK